MKYIVELFISKQWGNEHIDSIIACIKNDVIITFRNKKEPEEGIIFVDYYFDYNEVTLISHQGVGTKLIGPKKEVEKVKKLITDKYSHLG